MWLRNKKTGRVCDAIVRERKNSDGTYSTIVCTIEKRRPGHILTEYYSLAKLYEEWEDYKLAEPIIKDPNIRKAVRAWAEANGASRAYIVDLGMLRDESSGNEIKFNGEPFVGWVTSLKTITELCGEEEE